MCNETKINEAFRNAQSLIRGAKKDSKNPFHKSDYSSLKSVFDAIKEPFVANGFSISQPIDVRDDGRMVIITKLTHSSGECLESKMILPQIEDPQKIGSAITYYRRYSLMSLVGICPIDDDGNEATYISAKQISYLESIIAGHAEIRQYILDHCNNNISSITLNRYDNVINWVKNSLKEKNSEEMSDFVNKFDLNNHASPASKFIQKISESLDQPREKIIEDCSKDSEKFQKNLDKYIEKMNIKKSEEN